MTKLVLQWPIAYSGTDPRGVGWGLMDGGWPKFIDRHVKPALEWAKGVEVKILIHHPWGQEGDPMRIDGYTKAKEAGATWLTNEFATNRGWKRITSDYDCRVYLGGVDLTPYLSWIPTATRCEVIIENLRPIDRAGFRGVYIDAAENAITKPFNGVNEAQSNKPSKDVLTLAIADDMFPERTGIEAAPRAFPEFAHLWDRDCVMQETVYQHRYGDNRHGNWKALGYGIEVLTGIIWRTLPYSDDTTATVASAKQIAADGDVACICPAPLIRAGISANELTNNQVTGV